MNKKVIILLLAITSILLFLGLATLMTWMDLHYYVKLNEGVYQRVWIEKASFLLLLLGLVAFVVVIITTIFISATVILEASNEKFEEHR